MDIRVLTLRYSDGAQACRINRKICEPCPSAYVANAPPQRANVRKMRGKMEYDKTKVDEYTLALLYLVMWKEGDWHRAWKSFDWDTMARLYEKG